MNSETTDKTFLDSNQDKPRIVYRDFATLTTNVTLGSFSGGTVSFSLNQIKADVNTLFEVYVKDNQTGRVYMSPYININSSIAFDLNIFHYASSENLDTGDGNFRSIQYVTCNVDKRGGALTDTYTVYSVIYSTKINDNLIQGTF